jgi:AcrR family transcriptional regulator
MTKSLITRKESIVLTSIGIIDELGIDALSIRTIASRQNVVESSIYKHFKSKEEIIMEVLTYYFKYDDDIISTIEFGSFNAKESIVFFIESLMNIYQSNPALISLGHSFEIIKNSSPAVDKVREVFFKRKNFLASMVEKGKIENSFPLNVDSEFIAVTIIGIKKVVLTNWRMSKYSFNLKETVLNYINNILKMCIP